MKAISQNLMHSNLSITDGVYGILSSEDVGKKITELGRKVESGELNPPEIKIQIAKLSEMLKKVFNSAGKFE